MRILHRGENCDFIDIAKINSKHQFEAGEEFSLTSLLPLRMGRRTYRFDNPPKIIGFMSVAGKKEGDGPIGSYIHSVYDDPKLGKKSFELAEIDMLTESIVGAIDRSGLMHDDVELLLAGDLLNQITSSSYAARTLGIPYLGIYNACATMSEALMLGAFMINAGYVNSAACATVSHFATAEHQYRYPLEYGCQRPPYSQWTVTGAGCTVLSQDGEGPFVSGATVGKVVDYGINDINNMGAAMAPSAADTLAAHFRETGLNPCDYDLILTGDLGKLGSDILRELMKAEGYILEQNYIDCGSLIYSSEQDAYQGGSGAGCSATVFNSFVLEKILSGEYRRVLLAATGALMSTQSCFQGETMPAICHAVVIENQTTKGAQCL